MRKIEKRFRNLKKKFWSPVSRIVPKDVKEGPLEVFAAILGNNIKKYCHFLPEVSKFVETKYPFVLGGS